MAAKLDKQAIHNLLTVREFEPIAEKWLTKTAYSYYVNGADDELALRRNISAYDQLLILPRVLRDVTEIDMSTTLFGRRLAMPLVVAPSAMHRLAGSDGEMDVARAVAKSGLAMGLSSESTTSMEDVISCRTAAVAGAEDILPGFFFQLYLTDDMERNKILVRRAEVAGYQALVLTVDTPVLGNRLRERRNPLDLPEGLAFENLKNLPPAPSPAEGEPSWSYQVLAARTAAEAAAVRARAGTGAISAAITWDKVAELRRMTRANDMKLILKGIVHPADAELAVRIGADALVVSNHGGRQLDCAPATLAALPDIVAAVQGRVPILVDGGVRRGSDIFKAVCLGATAVMIGRPVLWGLAAGGQDGVEAVLNILGRELDRTMALAGTLSIAELSPAYLRLQQNVFSSVAKL